MTVIEYMIMFIALLYSFVKTLHDELDGKVSYINSLSRQISSLEGERQSLRDNIYDAENALKIAANDRQSLLNYVETMITAFTKVSQCIMSLLMSTTHG